ncbi:hypothetical protein TNCV_2028151 [Trichonephila clavipes]|nr:hypothetical protein TNCV_2028151 [Trichonephila clavipes]
MILHYLIGKARSRLRKFVVERLASYASRSFKHHAGDSTMYCSVSPTVERASLAGRYLLERDGCEVNANATPKIPPKG